MQGEGGMVQSFLMKDRTRYPFSVQESKWHYTLITKP